MEKFVEGMEALGYENRRGMERKVCKGMHSRTMVANSVGSGGQAQG